MLNIGCLEVPQDCYDPKQSQNAYIKCKEKERLEGVVAHTVIGPPAVMIHQEHATITHRAVVNKLGFRSSTLLALIQRVYFFI